MVDKLGMEAGQTWCCKKIVCTMKRYKHVERITISGSRQLHCLGLFGRGCSNDNVMVAFNNYLIRGYLVRAGKPKISPPARFAPKCAIVNAQWHHTVTHNTCSKKTLVAYTLMIRRRSLPRMQALYPQAALYWFLLPCPSHDSIPGE